MLVSFIITARDEDPQVLDATLADLYLSARQFVTETIIVDDGSSIPIQTSRAGVRILRNASPRGVSPSRRLGAATAVGEVLVWLDAHMSFGPHWLEQMLVHANTDSLLCSPFWSYDLRDCYCWGADFVWNPLRDYQAQKVPGFTLLHRVEPPAGLAVDVPMVIGACYMMRRDAYHRLGGFSPHFRIWGLDEQDISTRAWLAGYGVRCITQAKVGHLSRNAFPYPVQFEHLEFNQAVMFRSVFEAETVRRLEQHSRPLPAEVESWLANTDLAPWREKVQHARKLTDAEFFARFVPELAALDAAEQSHPQ
jgi:GT2 family glycosyltransferase